MEFNPETMAIALVTMDGPTRYDCHCVEVGRDKNRTPYAVATNGVAVVFTRGRDKGEDDIPANWSALIPAVYFRLFSKLRKITGHFFPRVTQDGADGVAFSYGELRIDVEPLTRFPSMRVIPKQYQVVNRETIDCPDGSAVDVWLGVSRLRKLLSAIEKMGDDQDVRLLVPIGEGSRTKPVMMRAKEVDGASSTLAYIMPLDTNVDHDPPEVESISNIGLRIDLGEDVPDDVCN